MPHQLANRGDRLVFSNGIVVLAVVASLLIVAFDANVTRLIQLYILGVFLSFTLSQAGMVRHWRDLLVEAGAAERPVLRRKQLVNALGGISTAVVFVIVLVTKFAEGAWIVVVAAPIIFATMKATARHYAGISDRARGARRPVWRCRGASMASSWYRTCWRRLCGRSPSPRRRARRRCEPCTWPQTTPTTGWPWRGASGVCRCRSW